MAVNNAFGVAGGTRGITHGTGAIFVKIRPIEAVALSANKGFITVGIAQGCLRHMRLVGQDHKAFNGRETILQLFK